MSSSSSSRPPRRGGGGGGGGRHGNPQQSFYSARRRALAAVARETQAVLPSVLAQLPHLRPADSEFLDLSDLPPLTPGECPKLTPARVPVRIVNEDSFNAAIDLASRHAGTGNGGSGVADRVAVLNLASDTTPGGGWLSGASAQEEALCYRSSLALSLHRRHYPWRATQGIYTRDVVIVRGATAQGHALLVPATKAVDLPVVSVLSIAGLRRPEVKTVNVISTSTGTGTNTATPSGGGATEGPATTTPAGLRFLGRKVFKNASDREATKSKMRMTLRMAARRGHRLLVLGAIGCGAFRNPVEDVAACWLEVLKEAEFGGGWWREVVFAVYDRKEEGNFEVFDRVLGGKEV